MELALIGFRSDQWVGAVAVAAVHLEMAPAPGNGICCWLLSWTTGILLVDYLSVWAVLVTILSLYRMVNLLRVIQGRLQARSSISRYPPHDFVADQSAADNCGRCQADGRQPCQHVVMVLCRHLCSAAD